MMRTLQMRVRLGTALYILDSISTMSVVFADNLQSEQHFYAVRRVILRYSLTLVVLLLSNWRNRQAFLALPGEQQVDADKGALKVE